MLFYAFNAISIYKFSLVYYETKSDVAIVLGAAINKGQISPVFKERINHSVQLYKRGIIKNIIFTGGVGEGKKIAESSAAKWYAIKNGIPSKHIFIEEKSKITLENLKEAKAIMNANKMKTALIVSDPLHMKRSIYLSRLVKINGKPSPTKTTMYRSFQPKLKSLLYESLYFSLRKLQQSLYWFVPN